MVKKIRSWLWSHYSPRLHTRYEQLDRHGQKRTNQQIGAIGEGVARDYIRSRGGKVIYKNFQAPKGGELDIVARDGEFLCFVEVKTRTKRARYNRPMDAVNAEKRGYIFKGAKAWRSMLKSEEMLWRYDIVEVILEDGCKPEVVWVKQAFSE